MMETNGNTQQKESYQNSHLGGHWLFTKVTAEDLEKNLQKMQINYVQTTQPMI